MTETPKEYLDRKGIKPSQSHMYDNGDLTSLYCWSYPNGDWIYMCDGYCHLIRMVDGEWVELTKGLRCLWILTYPNGDWEWQDDDDYWHPMHETDGEWVSLPKSFANTFGTSYPWIDWKVMDEDGNWHKVKQGDT